MAGRDDDDAPSIREIAALTARLRQLSNAGRDADPVERAAFLADKDALIARIEAANRQADTRAEEGRSGPARAAEPTGWGRHDIETAADDGADDGDGRAR